MDGGCPGSGVFDHRDGYRNIAGKRRRGDNGRNAVRKIKDRSIVAAVGIVAGMLILTGCASLERRSAMIKQELLTAAGFEMQFADTPGELARIQAMPQREIVLRRFGDEFYWTYADAHLCHCMFVGNQSAYLRFRHLWLSRKIAGMDESEAMTWHMWGPWSPWGPWR